MKTILVPLNLDELEILKTVVEGLAWRDNTTEILRSTINNAIDAIKNDNERGEGND